MTSNEEKGPFKEEKPILINDLKKILDVIDQQNSEDIKKLRINR